MKIKYPKFLFLMFTFLIAYLLFYNKEILFLKEILLKLNYFSSLIAGMLYSYGFTGGIATTLFLILAEKQNIFISAIIGGLGALIGDLIIFEFIRCPLKGEVEKLSKEKFVVFIGNKIPEKIKVFLIPLVGALMIASPLPDEIGIFLLATSKISEKSFSIISYFLNTIGIFMVLLIGKGI